MNWKKIEPGAFRALAENEVRILFLWHADHDDNITKPAEMELLIDQGRRLAKAGIVVSGAISSPADRAISAAYFTKAGMGSGGYTITDPRLADMKAEDPELVARLKAEAKAKGVEAEAHIFTICAENEKFHNMMLRRGHEGATALKGFCRKFRGQTILSASHGGSRMEVVIADLQGELHHVLQNGPEIFLERGQVAELIVEIHQIDIHVELRELHYLEPLQRNA